MCVCAFVISVTFPRRTLAVASFSINSIVIASINHRRKHFPFQICFFFFWLGIFFLFSLLFLILIDLFEFCCCEPAVMRALRNTPPASYCFSFLSQIRLEQTIIVFVSDMWRNVYRHALTHTHTHTHTHTLLLFQIMARCGWK